MTDTIGALRTRIRIESQTRVADEIGGVALAWTAQGEAWAEIVVGGGGEAGAYDAARSATSVRLRVRRRPGDWLRSRVRNGDAAYRVLAVRDDGGPWIELVCEEERL
ncbi:hypothetical protein U91I_02496 [alpha proteobacterium U9-1i]|nr:hypothetical protein U91I_02496 [alpha proteobacterium U9-1i]